VNKTHKKNGYPITMTTLVELVDNYRTDKNTVHSYLELYETLLGSKKETAKHVLEISDGNQGITYGGSVKLWRDYFTNATIHVVDIKPIQIWDGFRKNPRVQIHTPLDGYKPRIITELFINNDIRLDVAMDDGSHSLESMILFITLYVPLLAEDGILIIEDIPKWEWIDVLKSVVPEELRKNVEVYDLRPNKNRFDDIVFVVRNG
jgi:hypothetical protein